MPSGADAARLPADGKRRGGGPDADRQDHGEQLRHQVVDLRRNRHGHEQTRDARRDAGERCIRARLVLVEPEAEDQQRGGTRGTEGRARLFADPAVGDAEGEQEDESEKDRKATDPGEHASAHQILELLGAGRQAKGGDAPGGERHAPAPRCGRAARGSGRGDALDERRPLGLRPRRRPLHYGRLARPGP